MCMRNHTKRHRFNRDRNQRCGKQTWEVLPRGREGQRDQGNEGNEATERGRWAEHSATAGLLGNRRPQDRRRERPPPADRKGSLSTGPNSSEKTKTGVHSGENWKQQGQRREESNRHQMRAPRWRQVPTHRAGWSQASPPKAGGSGGRGDSSSTRDQAAQNGSYCTHPRDCKETWRNLSTIRTLVTSFMPVSAPWFWYYIIVLPNVITGGSWVNGT